MKIVCPHIEDIEMLNKDNQKQNQDAIAYKSKNNTSFSLFNVHYLHVVSCYLYLKSYEGCSNEMYDCDYYFDKFTALYKILLIVGSGFINALLLFLSIIHIYNRKVLFLETLSIISSYFLLNFLFSQVDSFGYTWGIFCISLIFFTIVFFFIYFIWKIPSFVLSLYEHIRKIMIINLIIKIKIFILSDCCGNLIENIL